MSNTNSTFLTSLAIVAIGYWLKQRRILPDESGKVLSRLVLYVTFPAMIYQTFTRVKIEPALVFLPLICLAYGGGVVLLAYRLFRRKPETLKGLLLMAVTGFNMGLFAFPLIEGVWGMEGLQYAAMFDIGNACLVLGLNYVTGALYSPRESRSGSVLSGIAPKLLRAFPLQMYVLALLVNGAGLETPAFLSNIIGVLARANMALVLVLLGIYLNFDLERSILRPLGSVLTLRYGCGLVAGSALFLLLPFNQLYRSVLLIGLILPVGLTILPFSDEFGYDPRLAGALANVSIVLSFGLMWLLISLLHLA